jgi:hypothetical protein
VPPQCGDELAAWSIPATAKALRFAEAPRVKTTADCGKRSAAASARRTAAFARPSLAGAATRTSMRPPSTLMPGRRDPALTSTTTVAARRATLGCADPGAHPAQL